MDLAAREADLAIRITAKPPEYLIGKRVLPLRHGVYASPGYLDQAPTPANVIVFRGEKQTPEWVAQHFPGARIVLRTDNINSMRSAASAGIGLARLPCFEADSDPSLRRLDLELAPSAWGIWVLSHADLRSTARVRACREFVIDVIEQSADLVLGNASVYA